MINEQYNKNYKKHSLGITLILILHSQIIHQIRILEHLPVSPTRTTQCIRKANMTRRGAFLVGGIGTMLALGTVGGGIVPVGAAEETVLVLCVDYYDVDVDVDVGEN